MSFTDPVKDRRLAPAVGEYYFKSILIRQAFGGLIVLPLIALKLRQRCLVGLPPG